MSEDISQPLNQWGDGPSAQALLSKLRLKPPTQSDPI